MEKEVQEVIDFNANLTPERKAIIEFMRDGPRSTGQAGHWLQFAQLVSIRDQNDLDTDVKMFLRSPLLPWMHLLHVGKPRDFMIVPDLGLWSDVTIKVKPSKDGEDQTKEPWIFHVNHGIHIHQAILYLLHFQRMFLVIVPSVEHVQKF